MIGQVQVNEGDRAGVTQLSTGGIERGGHSHHGLGVVAAAGLIGGCRREGEGHTSAIGANGEHRAADGRGDEVLQVGVAVDRIPQLLGHRGARGIADGIDIRSLHGVGDGHAIHGGGDGITGFIEAGEGEAVDLGCGAARTDGGGVFCHATGDIDDRDVGTVVGASDGDLDRGGRSVSVLSCSVR